MQKNFKPMLYCPYCGKKLEHKEIHERVRGTCADCHFIDFGAYVLGVGGIILDTNSAGETEILLIQRNHNPGKGGWYLPGGYVEFDELAHKAIVREIEEETGLKTEVSGLVSYRNWIENKRNDSYAIFMLTVVGGDLIQTPTSEIAQIGYFTQDELARLNPISETSQIISMQAVRDELHILKPHQLHNIDDDKIYVYL